MKNSELIVGADTERRYVLMSIRSSFLYDCLLCLTNSVTVLFFYSGTGWDELYYGEMEDLNIAGKKVAVFGLGDSVSYAENYADASGEVRIKIKNDGENGFTVQLLSDGDFTLLHVSRFPTKAS